jgi:hypothetical protein
MGDKLQMYVQSGEGSTAMMVRNIGGKNDFFWL